MTSLKKLALRGTLWTLFSYGFTSVLRLGSNLILTRLLFPELFGLMTLVGTLVNGLVLFSDIGFGPNIIQNKRGDDPDFLNTAWTMQILRGGIVWVLCTAIAVPAAYFYHQPQLSWLIPTISFGVVLGSFESTAIFTLSRHMDFRRLEIFRLTVQTLATAVTLLWAWLNPSIWAFVAGALATAIFNLVGSHLLVPSFRNRFTWDKTAVRELFAFGKWVFFSTASTFLGMQADRLILGRLIPFGLLGVYGIAIGFSELPRSIVYAIGNKVLLPVMAKVSDLPRSEFRAKLLKHRLLLLLGGALMVAALASFGDVVISTLYDKRYNQAEWMLPILALGIWPNLLHESSRQALTALGKPNYEACGQFLKGLTVCLGVPLGFHLMGILGAVAVVALNDIPLYAVISYGLRQEGLSTLKQDLLTTGSLLAMLGIILTGRWLLGFGLPIQTLFSA